MNYPHLSCYQCNGDEFIRIAPDWNKLEASDECKVNMDRNLIWWYCLRCGNVIVALDTQRIKKKETDSKKEGAIK